MKLTATPASATYKFVNWTGTNPTTTTNPLTVTMNGAVSETANFTLNQVNVTAATSVPGLSFSVDGTTYTASKTLTWRIGDMHTIATTSPQILTTMGGYAFSSCSDGGAMSHTATSSASILTYTAKFTQTATYLSPNQVTTNLKATGFNKNTGVSTFNYTITNKSTTASIPGPIQVVMTTPTTGAVNNTATVQGYAYRKLNSSIPPKLSVGLIIEVVTRQTTMPVLNIYSKHL